MPEPTLNPYRSVIGVLPRQRDVIAWSHDRFMDFFSFVEFFVEGQVIKVTRAKRLEVEKFLDIPHHPWAEFLYRIDRMMVDGKNEISFYQRLAGLIRQVGFALKKNPALMSDEMKERIKDNPRLNWMIANFKKIETKVGAETIVPATLDTTGFSPRTTTSINVEVQSLEGVAKTVNLYNLLASSFKPHEIRSMDVKDRINAMQKLSFIHNLLKASRPNSQTFKQINIYKAGKEELEKSLSEFSEEQEQQK